MIKESRASQGCKTRKHSNIREIGKSQQKTETEVQEILKRYMHPMFIALLFTYNSQDTEATKCPSTDE